MVGNLSFFQEGHPGRFRLVQFCALVSLATPCVVADARWSLVGQMSTGRYHHTATLLQDGRVLVAGGVNKGLIQQSAELYDPTTGQWTSTGNLNQHRKEHTATLLPNGKVLVVGGSTWISGSQVYLSSAEIYDPASETWSTATGELTTARERHTATLQRNGNVLIIGGENARSGVLTSVEVYDPAAQTFTVMPSLKQARKEHTATLLADGRMLVVGGLGASAYLSSAELFGPNEGNWSLTGALAAPRANHTATLLPTGKVLVAGGINGGAPLAGAERYDPGTGGWSLAAGMVNGRTEHTATLLPNGRVVAAGGASALSPSVTEVPEAEVYDYDMDHWFAAGVMNSPRYRQTATMLASGQVLVTGGIGQDCTSTPCITADLAITELFDSYAGAWSTTGSMAAERILSTVTLLPNGKVLVAGGSSATVKLNAAEVYDPVLGNWGATAPMSASRAGHAANLLFNGKVLISGGEGNSDVHCSVELYDPLAGNWTGMQSMNVTRRDHTATLLSNGQVLVAGGINDPVGTTFLKSAELFNPRTGSWSMTGSMSSSRALHTATLLPNGQVLVVGGWASQIEILNSAELYEPAAGTWKSTAALARAHARHSATLLPCGQVLVAGGQGAVFGPGVDFYLHSTELFNPSTGTWKTTGSMSSARGHHTATLLLNGKVLATGGRDSNVVHQSTELYDHLTGLWSQGNPMATLRMNSVATLLPGGNVLVIGGDDYNIVNKSAELYDPVSAPIPWRPFLDLDLVSNTLDYFGQLVVGGNHFRGLSEASGGNGSQNSSTDYPLVLLRSLNNGQTRFLPPDPTAAWTDQGFTSKVLGRFPAGHALVTVFTNGIPSMSKIVNITQPEFLWLPLIRR